jgi:hypothetical protein
MPRCSALRLVALVVADAYSESEVSEFLRGADRARLSWSAHATEPVRRVALAGGPLAPLEHLQSGEVLAAARQRISQEHAIEERVVLKALFIGLSSGLLDCE